MRFAAIFRFILWFKIIAPLRKIGIKLRARFGYCGGLAQVIAALAAAAKFQNETKRNEL